MTAYARACVDRLYACVYNTELIVQSKVAATAATAATAAAAAAAAAAATTPDTPSDNEVRQPLYGDAMDRLDRRMQISTKH